MRFTNGNEIANDCVALALLTIKNKTGLSFQEKRRFGRLRKVCEYTTSSNLEMILHSLHEDKYITLLNHITYQDINGNPIDPDKGKTWEYHVEKKGEELLIGPLFDSEYKDRKWKKWQQSVSFYGAILGSVISLILLFLKIRESLGR